jgi:hypothetical protein
MIMKHALKTGALLGLIAAATFAIVSYRKSVKH